MQADESLIRFREKNGDCTALMLQREMYLQHLVFTCFVFLIIIEMKMRYERVKNGEKDDVRKVDSK